MRQTVCSVNQWPINAAAADWILIEAGGGYPTSPLCAVQCASSHCRGGWGITPQRRLTALGYWRGTENDRTACREKPSEVKTDKGICSCFPDRYPGCASIHVWSPQNYQPSSLYLWVSHSSHSPPPPPQFWVFIRSPAFVFCTCESFSLFLLRYYCHSSCRLRLSLCFFQFSCFCVDF